jgi:ATP adenylyltransferase
MDRLWTPWRYNYVTGADRTGTDGAAVRRGVPVELVGWPGADTGCVFCNLTGSVRWAMGHAEDPVQAELAERAGHVVAWMERCFVILNAFPYSSGHLLVLPYEHTDSLAKLPVETAREMMDVAQRMETTLREVYRPHGINLGMNLGQAAGAGVAEHIHLHVVPRWFGDTNFMTVTAETRVLPESLNVSWKRLREAYRRL